MECSYNKVLQDFNYDKLQLVQEKYKSLEHQQKEKDGIIDYLGNNWSSSLSEDRMAAKELYRIIDTNFTGRSTPKANNLIHILSLIRYVADRLNDISLQSEAVIQKANKYYWSLDDDIEGISALGNDSTPITPTMKSCLDDEVIFDTDDTCSDDST